MNKLIDKYNNNSLSAFECKMYMEFYDRLRQCEQTMLVCNCRPQYSYQCRQCRYKDKYELLPKRKK